MSKRAEHHEVGSFQDEHTGGALGGPSSHTRRYRAGLASLRFAVARGHLARTLNRSVASSVVCSRSDWSPRALAHAGDDFIEEFTARVSWLAFVPFSCAAGNVA